MQIKKRFRSTIWAITSIIGFLLIWELLVRILAIKPFILPSPRAVGQALIDTRALLWQHGLVTLGEGLAGFGIAIVVSLVIAVAMAEVKIINFLLHPLIVLSQTIPIITLAPLIIIWFGYGVLPKILIVILVCFFPITINLYHGLTVVDPQIIGLLKTMGASRRQILTIAKLPGAMAHFFAGLKIAAAYSIMGAIIGEWLGAQQGLGVFMTRAQASFAIDRVLAAVVIIAALSMLLFYVIRGLEQMLMPWQNLQETGGKNNAQN